MTSDELDSLVNRLHNLHTHSGDPDTVMEAAYGINRLRKERDEARRLYCVMRDGDDGASCADWAKRKGWDCFKENTND